MAAKFDNVCLGVSWRGCGFSSLVCGITLFWSQIGKFEQNAQVTPAQIQIACVAVFVSLKDRSIVSLR